MKNKFQIRTASELKAAVDATGSHFFTRDTMRFFGDTMANYGVRQPGQERPQGSRFLPR